MKTTEIVKREDRNGSAAFWIWTCPTPRAVEGRKRGGKKWHAFPTAESAFAFWDDRDGISRANDEVGTGVPDQHTIIDCDDFTDHRSAEDL